MKRLILLFWGIALFFQLDAQQISRFEYFIDTDPGEGNATPVSFVSDSAVDFSFSVNLNALDNGIHRLFMRAMDDSGRWSQVMKRNFYIESLQDEQLSDLTKIEYFIDNDPGFGNATPVSISTGTTGEISFTANLSALNEGLHHLLMRARDVDGKWSVLTKRDFLIETLKETPPDLTRLEYFIDTDPGYGNANAINITSGAVQDVDFAADLTGFDQGIHRLFVRGKDSNGKWSNVSKRTFLIETLPRENLAELTNLEYFFDSDPGYGNGNAVPVDSGALQEINISADLSALDGSSHTIFIRGKDVNGKWSIVYRDEFCIGPQAQFSAINACFGDSVVFIDESVDTIQSTVYSWDVDNDGNEDYNSSGDLAHFYEEPGTYHPSLVVYDEASCRDTFSTEVTVYPTDTITEAATICEGETYRGFTESGTHYITETNSMGCDSITEIILTVDAPFLSTDTMEICQGDSLNWRDSIYTQTGVFSDSLLSVNGCDSIYQLDLTVHPSYLFTDTVEICAGDTLTWHQKEYSSEGVYFDSLSTVSGCDSIYQLTLAVNPRYLFTDSAEIYEGEVYTWRENDYDTAATYYDSLTTIKGCDSLYLLVLDVLPTDTNLVADLTLSPSRGNITTTFTFDGSGSSNADHYKWDFEGDGNWDTGFEENPTTTHTYSNPGDYSVTLVVKNAQEEYDTLSTWLTVDDYVAIPEDSMVLEYFFDENVSLLQGNLEFFDPESPGGILNFQAPVEHLDDGIHKLYYRVRDTRGQWTQTYNRVFVKTDDGVVVPRDSVVFEYFFDEQTALLDGNTTTIDTATWDGDFSINAPVEMLEQGVHELYYRFRGKHGHWSQTYNRTFLKERLHTDTAPEIEYLEYHLNKDNGFGNGISVDVSDYQGDSIDFVADISGLADSCEIFIYARNDRNQWSFEYHDKFYIRDCEPFFLAESHNICDGDTLTWRDKEYFASGTYHDSLTSAESCDSVYQLNLTVFDLPDVDLGKDKTITTEESVTLEPGDFVSYLWQDNTIKETYTVNGSDYTPGDYEFRVWVKDENTCQAGDTITITIEGVTGIKSILEGTSVLIYPNPAAKVLNIEFVNVAGEKIYLDIVSIDGKVIYSNEFENPTLNTTDVVDVSEFSTGVYTVRIRSGQTVKTKRLIIGE